MNDSAKREARSILVVVYTADHRPCFFFFNCPGMMATTER